MPNNTTSLDIDAMSTEEKLEQIKMLRELISLKEKSNNEQSSSGDNGGTFPNISANNNKTFISGTVMSVVFVTCFMLIVAMAAYSFHTLYIAVQKKYPSTHTEL